MYKEMSLRERSRHNPHQYGMPWEAKGQNNKKVSKETMFEAYKRRLMTDDTQPGKVKQWTRYNVIQYLCSFPKLDPDEMAAALMREGIEIRFDDSSISVADNAKHQRRVMRIVRAMERRSEDNRRVTGGNTR
jgi:hypothetical protein